MLGLVGAAAGLGNFAGNATGARLKLGRPALIVLRCTASVWIIAVIAALTDNLMTGRACHAHRIGRQRTRQGLTRRVTPARPARGIDRVPDFGRSEDGSAAELGTRRRIGGFCFRPNTGSGSLLYRCS